MTLLSLALVAFANACEAHDRVLPYLGVHDSGRQADSGKASRPSDADVTFDNDPSEGVRVDDDPSTEDPVGQPDDDAPTVDVDNDDVDKGSVDRDAAAPVASARDAGAEDEVPVEQPHGAADPECDMTGLWMVKQLTRSEALGLGQFANYYYFFELAQDGEDVTVVDQMDCNMLVEGTVLVTVTEATRRSLMTHNNQRGRKATMQRTEDDHCALTFERWWSVRGAEEAKFVPKPRNSKETMAQLRMRLPLPTAQMRAGAEDWDDDGQLGIAWQISGIASGTRNTAQRDYSEWYTDDSHTITPARDFKKPLVLRCMFDNDENVLNATSGLVGSLAVADQRAEHRVSFSFLGRDKNDARAKAILADDPLVTCNHITSALPQEKQF